MQHDTTILTVFGNIMEVVPSDDNGAGHFGGNNFAGQDTATDGDFTSEWAFLICHTS